MFIFALCHIFDWDILSELETSCREGSITGGAGSDRTTSPGDADETASIPQELVCIIYFTSNCILL